MTSKNRRQFLGTSAALALGLGCGKKSNSGQFAGRELNIFAYGGGHEATMRDVFVPYFEAMTGATVTIHAGWRDSMARLKASPKNAPPFDLMITDAIEGYPAAREGLFAQIDPNSIPNLASLYPATLDNWIVKQGYGITYPDSVLTFAFHKHSVPDAPVTWADLLRPALAGKLGLYKEFYMSLYTFTCALAALEGKPGTARQLIETNIDSVMAFARKNRRLVKYWWPTSTAMILSLANRDCAAGNMHSPEYLQALREKPELGATVPLADRAFVQVFWAVTAESPNRDLAERAINELFSYDMQLGFSQRGQATSRLDVAEKMAADDPVWKSLYPHSQRQFSDLNYYPYDTYAKQWNDLSDRWDRTILRDG